MFNFFRKAHEAPEIAQSQYRAGGRKDRILRFFQKRQGEAVGLNEILKNFRDIADPTRTIRYLEADWYHIENKTTHTKKACHSTYTYLGYDLLFKKPKKRTYTQEEVNLLEDEAYEQWYESCIIQYDLLPKKRGRPLGSKNK